MSVMQATICESVLRQSVCVTDKIKVHVHPKNFANLGAIYS